MIEYRARNAVGLLRLLAQARQWMLLQSNRIAAVFLPEPYHTVLPYTMVDLKRLRNLDMLVRRLDETKVTGDIVECGTCNGGSGAVLANAVLCSRYQRHVWLLDSFAGLPPATVNDGPGAQSYVGLCPGSLERVTEVLRRVGIPENTVTIVPGWFRDTLPTLPASRIALLHIDADWYESVRDVLEHLYDRVVAGGYLVLDDFGYWPGCRTACLDFLAARNIHVSIIDVDGIGAYFQKPT